MKRTAWGIIYSTLLCAPTHVAAAQDQRKQIYIAPDDHTDYLWTADEPMYERAMLDMTRYYLDLVDRTKDNPADFQAKWNFDGSLWMRVWERNNPPDQIQRLVGRLQDGHFSMPLNYAVSTYGGMPTEAVLRSMYYSGEVQRRYHLQLPLAVAMENQTLPRGLASLFAGSGAKYSWRGVCACATKMKPVISQTRPQEIYWWKGPDDQKVLLKWNSLFSGGPNIGTYLEARYGVNNVNFVDKSPAFRAAYPYNIVGLFGEGGDDLQTSNPDFVDVAKQTSNAQRRVIVSNEVDFFEAFERQYGKKLPEVTLALGNEWDMYSASMAQLSASVRDATERLRGAEGLATLVTLKRPDFYDRFAASRADAWDGMGLYWEHDWTADSKILPRRTRELWQRQIAKQVITYVDTLQTNAQTALGSMIARTGNAPRFYVFNPLSWSRSDAADLSYSGPTSVHVSDVSTGLDVPYQWIERSGRHGEKEKVLRVWAADIPSVGYKVFEIAPGLHEMKATHLQAHGDAIENDDVRVTVGKGGELTSLIAKRIQSRELLSRVNGRAANDWGSGAGDVTVVNAGPVSATLRITIHGSLPRVTEVTLYRESSRVDIQNEVLANFSGVQTWTFSFNLDHPDVHHEEVGAINHARIAPEGDYAPTFSRLDWLTLNHFATMNGTDGVGLTLANQDAAFVKLGHTEMVDGVPYLDEITPQLTVLAGGQVDGPSLGIENQGGDAYLRQRFALKPYSTYDAASSMRMSLEHQNPLMAERLTGAGIGYPQDKFSLLSVSDPNTAVWSVKPSEEGPQHGIVVRTWNLAAGESQGSLAFAVPITSAQEVTHIESPLRHLDLDHGTLKLHARPWQMQTFAMVPGVFTSPSLTTKAAN